MPAPLNNQDISREEAWARHYREIEEAYRFHEGVDIGLIALQTFDDGHYEALWGEEES